MASFDSILNAVIPWLVLVVGIYLLYRPLKEPLSGLFGWIGDLIRRIFVGKEEYIDLQPTVQFE